MIIVCTSFMDQNDEGCGRVLRAPFTAIGELVTFAKCMDRMKDFSRVDYGAVPFFIILACMHNRKEYNIVSTTILSS